MAVSKRTPASAIVGYFSGLRFPTLLVLVAGLFFLDLAVPDLIPFVDEILLGLGTALLASWKKRRTDGDVDTGSDDAKTIDVDL